MSSNLLDSNEEGVIPWGDLAHDSKRDATIVVQEVVAEGSHATFRNLVMLILTRRERKKPVHINVT